MTPHEVHTIQFHKPPIGRRGYDELAVDDLLDRIEDSLAGQSRITLDELATMKFPKPPIGQRGYLKSDVDTFIQLVIAQWPTPANTEDRPATRTL